MYLTMSGAVRAADRSAESIKSYEKAGKIKPIRDSRNRRLYSPEDIAEIKRISAENEVRHAAQIANLHIQRDAS